MTVDVVLDNAKIFHRGAIEGGVAIDEERIVKIAKSVNLPAASERIDLKGMLILPGLIDIHVHLRDQGLSYKEDFFSGTSAAANGGVTLTVDMPNNKPVTMDLESLKERMRIAGEKVVVNVGFYCAFPRAVEEIPWTVEDGGSLAFKLFMSQQIGGIDPLDEQTLGRALTEAARVGVTVAVHAEDARLLSERRMNLRGNGGIEAYLKVHSSEVEVDSVNHVLRLSRNSGVQIHFCHISSAESMSAIAGARKAGLSATTEVTPHHLLISSNDLKRIGPIALADPPSRSQQDIDELWMYLSRSMVDVLASDHAPHTIEEKKEKSVWLVKTGIPGLETMLPLMLTEVNRGRMSLATLARMTSTNPSRILGLKGRGDLKEGNYADLVVVDMKREYRIDSSLFHSKAKYSPFDGWTVKGKPVKTFVNGHVVMDEGEILAKPGSGRVLRCSG